MIEQFDPNTEHDNCGTEEDTASLGKDWYLIAINPWHKWYFNPKTNQTKHIQYKDNNGNKS